MRDLLLDGVEARRRVFFLCVFIAACDHSHAIDATR